MMIMSSRKSKWISRKDLLLLASYFCAFELTTSTTGRPWTCHAFSYTPSVASWQQQQPRPVRIKRSRASAIPPGTLQLASRTGDDAFPVRVPIRTNPQETISSALVSSISTAPSIATTPPVFQNERVVTLPTIASPITTATLPALSLSSNKDSAQQQQDEMMVYQRGLTVIAFITLLFASNSPALHAAFSMIEQRDAPPPVLLLNAACSAVALVGMLVVGPWLDRATPTVLPPRVKTNPGMDTSSQPRPIDQDGKSLPSSIATSLSNNIFVNMLIGENSDRSSISAIQDRTTLQAGMELGTWKMLGTLLNIVGLSLTSAGHGAFLIQLTTLFVPLAQGFLGVPIPQRIWTAIALALGGVLLFTLDDSGGNCASSLMGDAACVGAAVLYATYDLRLFHWGQQVEPLRLITTKIITQTVLSVAVLMAFAAEPAWDYVQSASTHDLALVGAVTVWSGLAVNALAPYLQVGGQQAVGPARAQILYASQPLWAAFLSFVVLGETVGTTGLVGGGAFLLAMLLAATAELPNPDCGENVCEV